MTTLSDIRERDAIDERFAVHAVPKAIRDAITQAARDRRHLLQLIDAYQAREREARELLEEAEGPEALWIRDFDQRRDAWLAAQPIEGEPSA